MRRQRFRKPVTNVSLFPFIAVLICTMGALIVLLVLVVQQARVQADTITIEREARETISEDERRRRIQEQEDLDWQREILEQQRAELNKQMADERLRLSHLEEHIRRLEDRLQRVQAEAIDLERLKNDDTQSSAAQQLEIERLKAEIEREREALEAARDEAANNRKSFTIIAYRGPNGTRRRPIYIECRESGIFLQPEGIVLNASDFSGPLGPGNPLDAALRTIREHWQHVEGEASKGEPYPLLVVRPDGAAAYAMARAAMASWDDEFGYELVDADLELAFPPSDPVLGQMLAGTVRTARQRQAMLAAAMPSRFEAQDTTSYSVPDRDFGPRGPADGTPTGYGVGAGGAGDQLGASGPPRSEVGSGDYPPSDAPGSEAFGDSPGVSESEYIASNGMENGPPGSDAAGGMASAAAGGSCATGQCPSGGSSSAGGTPMQSLAIPNGANWALPQDVSGLTAITRPIIVECHPNRWVIRPDRGDQRSPQVIPMNGTTRGSIDAFVTGVQTHMRRWGMAVAGGFWNPVVRVEVLPGAENRFREMETLLRGSGIQVERR